MDYRLKRLCLGALLCLVTLIPTGCAGPLALAQSTPDAVVLTGDPVRGEALFKTGLEAEKVPACASCHPIHQTGFSVGPALSGIRERASTRVAGLSADDYIRQSMLEPNAFVVASFRPIMYPDYAKHFSQQQILDLIAYLKTL